MVKGLKKRRCKFHSDLPLVTLVQVGSRVYHWNVRVNLDKLLEIDPSKELAAFDKPTVFARVARCRPRERQQDQSDFMEQHGQG